MWLPHGSRRVPAEDLDPGLAGRRKHGLPVVDHEPDMPSGVRGLRPSLGERDELVAHVDERHPADSAAQLNLEQPAVEGQRLVDRPDLERDVVHADRARHAEQLIEQP
jgi:hypothetical protein